jgi:hypothetical protein
MWTFTACTRELLKPQLMTTNFYGKLQLYGPDGALLATATDSTDDLITYIATNCGTFTLLVSSSDYGGVETGTYGFSANGLANEMRLCAPAVSNTVISVSAVGGASGATFTLVTTTNVATPPGLWSPIWTNQFGPDGVFTYTNFFNPGQLQQYFYFTVP